MAKTLEPIFEETLTGKNNSISPERVFSKALTYWPLFAIAIGIALIGAFIYMEQATPLYTVRAKVLIKDEKKGAMAEGQLFQDLGVGSGQNSVDNEIEIFKSKTLVQNVISALHFNIRYYTQKGFSNKEVYGTLPFEIVPLFDVSSVAAAHVYSFKPGDGENYIIRSSDRSWNGNWGDTILLPMGKVTIEKKSSTADFKSEYTVVVNPASDVAKNYLGALEVAPVNKQVSIVNISLVDAFPERGELFINKLIEMYMQANIDDRNRVANGTIEFIDERLLLIGDELGNIERQIQGFKQQNELTDLSEQSRVLLDYTSENTKQLTQQEIQLSIVTSLEKYLQDNSSNRKAIPSTFFIQDLTLTGMINSYNASLAQKERLLLSNTPGSPYVQNIEQQLNNARADIRENLSSLRRTLEVSTGEMRRRMSGFNTQMNDMPEKERVFLEYSRQQNIKQELYLYLLKTREETAISKSSNSPNLRVIDVAEGDKMPFAPNKTRVFLTAIVIGLLLPSAVVAAKELLNTKISEKSDITSVTSIPVVGEISQNTKDHTIVVKKDSRSRISEQFRVLRTNIQFLLPGENEKVILVTSSMSGEGKSFVSLNLASTLALSGKRTLLMELDLRKPKLSEYLGLDGDKGFSNYIIKSSSLNDIIKPSGVLPDLCIISSGAIPPNPAELLMLSAVDNLFQELRKEFDHIIIDSAPVGLVTDAQLLAKHADVTLYVVRQNTTHKQQIANVDHLYKSGKLPGMALVINGITASQMAYGYGNYGQYGNGYFEEEGNSRLKQTIQNIRHRFTRNT